MSDPDYLTLCDFVPMTEVHALLANERRTLTGKTDLYSQNRLRSVSTATRIVGVLKEADFETAQVLVDGSAIRVVSYNRTDPHETCRVSVTCTQETIEVEAFVSRDISEWLCWLVSTEMGNPKLIEENSSPHHKVLILKWQPIRLSQERVTAEK